VGTVRLYGLTNWVKAFSSTSLLYGIPPIFAIRAMVIPNRSGPFRLLNL
jgi:hypothetical protein